MGTRALVGMDKFIQPELCLVLNISSVDFFKIHSNNNNNIKQSMMKLPPSVYVTLGDSINIITSRTNYDGFKHKSIIGVDIMNNNIYNYEYVPTVYNTFNGTGTVPSNGVVFVNFDTVASPDDHLKMILNCFNV
jgi:hypothetical protein